MNASLSEKIFEKKLDEITKEDFFNFFIKEQEETSNIEFKSGGVEIEDIFREICAFLNTDGGLLFIGTPTETKKQINNKIYKRVCIGNPIPSKFLNKGWIFQKIYTNIVPIPNHINIQELLTDDGNHFIIEVPQSMNPPHQCLNEGKYYIRIDQETKPAPHGFVQALFFKRQKALVTSRIELKNINILATNEIETNIHIFNNTEYPADNISYLVNIYNIDNVSSNSYHENSNNFRKKDEKTYEIQNTYKEVLIKKVSLPISFKIIHFNKPFIFLMAIWGKEFNYYENIFIWDPIKSEKIFSTETGDGKNITYNEIIDKYNEIKI